MIKKKAAKFISAVLFWIVFSSAVFAGTPWNFIVTGDSRGDLLYGYNNNGVNTIILGEIAAETVVQGVDFFLLSGDLVIGDTNQTVFESQLITWRETMQPIYDANISVYVVRGNHEDTGDVTVWQSIFSDLPGNGPEDEEKLTYSVAHKNAFVVGLDQYVGSQWVNQRWLDTQFATNTSPHVFVFAHYPAFGPGGYSSASIEDEINTFWASIKKAGGRTYFAGHYHLYDHSHIDDGDGDPNNDIHQYIIGTAGAPQIFPPIRYGYVLVEIDGLNVTLTWMERDSDDLDVPGTYEPNEVWSYTALPITLLTPNGGETLLAGATYPITWQTDEGPNIEYVLIEYSPDNGADWNDVDIWPNTGSYEWDIPLVDSNECLVRISDLYNTSISDTSYSVFTIFQCQGPIVGDLNEDCHVDFLDFAMIAAHWLKCGNRFYPDCGLE